ncbi:syndetin-like isoform X2 [Branchiostoma floridae]|uniref:Syndetin-like isoform X2 n=1 Tax=Branchiostoma floridae TaxID=7739 RepID=A0A9J7LU45_BRAFL|nr:syndetin-like isoform X2 [Branchiostoma floridae]
MKKLKSLVALKDKLQQVGDEDRSPTSPDRPLYIYKEEEREFPNDPLADQEAIDSIEEVYYKDDSWDPSKHELQKLHDGPEKLSLEDIDKDRNRLRRQLAAVSKKVSELVLENHPAYAQELQRVMDLETALQGANVICINGRRHLEIAKQGFTTASLGLLANQRKRSQLLGLMNSLRTIKTLQRTDVRLREMLEEEDYPGAIQLCLECQKAASIFRHYSCISDLSSKLQDTLEMIEEQLDVALSKTCNSFDAAHYEKVQTAYRLLGKTQTAMDQLHMHYASAIHNTAFQIVLGYVELCSGTGDTNFQKMQYKDLCTDKHIITESYIPCLMDLCKALWGVMNSYHKTMQWHELHDSTNQETAEAGLQFSTSDATSSINIEATFNQRYVKQKLEHGLARIWQDVQQKVKLYLLGTDLSVFKFDDFLHVLDLVNKLMLIGEEFCNSKSEGLQDSIRKQSINYFKNYHRSRMDELRMFLENEAWELCPVKSNFTILNLQEFKFLRRSGLVKKLSSAMSSPQSSPAKLAETRDRPGDAPQGFFVRYGDHGNPFDVHQDEDDGEDVMATNGYDEDEKEENTYADDDSDDSDVPEELKQDFVDEKTGETPVRRDSRKKYDKSRKFNNAPILTNTTLNVLRLFGKYMQMMNVLKPIAFDVVICMSQLFDYYLFSVYSFFATDLDLSAAADWGLSNKLKTTLKRINDNLILPEDSMMPNLQQPVQQVEDRKDKVPFPHVSPVVDLTGTQNLYGLAERVVATESLVFLADQFEFLQPQLESVIPPAKKAFLQQFYSQTISTASELRRPVYRVVAAKSVVYDHILQLMANVKWDIKDIMSQHSSYVDVLLRELQVFSNKLDQVGRHVPIPQPVYNVLWEHCIRLANRTFVEGFASAKKCSNEGRALMQLDFQQFLMKLEKLTDLRPIPDREFVEVYVKAYYLTDADMERWIRDHREYSTKQLTGLVMCGVGSHINKKARQRLLATIEDMEKLKR